MQDNVLSAGHKEINFSMIKDPSALSRGLDYFVVYFAIFSS